MKTVNHVKTVIAAALLTFVCLTVSVYAEIETFAYSSDSDPLVTLSYIQKIKEQLREEILAELKTSDVSSSGTDSAYEVVTLAQGQYIMAVSSCEIILRSGGANVVVTGKANIDNRIGLSDVTTGNELVNGTELPQNHYVVIPRADGRGVVATSASAYFMVRGDYEIVKN